jgi:hypothetical protein
VEQDRKVGFLTAVADEFMRKILMSTISKANVPGSGRFQFPEIVSYIEREIGAKVDQNALFMATSKLVQMKVLKLNEDITGTFSLQNWKE